MPFGRPVVPDEYSIEVPSSSWVSGVDGCAAVAASKSSKGASSAAAPAPTTRQRVMPGHSVSASRTTSSLERDVMRTCDWELFRM